jgi:hypothetical protein
MYPKAKYISIFESKFVRPNKTGRDGATYATDSDKMVTIRLDAIVSIHTQTIEYSHHRYCTVTMSNGFRYNITETTADEIRLCLDIDNVYERGEE